MNANPATDATGTVQGDTSSADQSASAGFAVSTQLTMGETITLIGDEYLADAANINFHDEMMNYPVISGYDQVETVVSGGSADASENAAAIFAIDSTVVMDERNSILNVLADVSETPSLIIDLAFSLATAGVVDSIVATNTYSENIDISPGVQVSAIQSLQTSDEFDFEAASAAFVNQSLNSAPDLLGISVSSGLTSDTIQNYIYSDTLGFSAISVLDSWGGMISSLMIIEGDVKIVRISGIDVEISIVKNFDAKIIRTLEGAVSI
jgi:hypothetical protein